MIDICLLGTGGMMPLPGRHLTSLLIRHNGHSILVDCGEGTQVAIRKYGWTMHSIDVICFTHTHGDHVAGISGLLSSMGSDGRTEPVHIIGPRHIEEIVANICVVVTVPFDVVFHPIENEEPYREREIDITPFRVEHSVICYGYKFELKRKPKFLPEKAKELGIPVNEWKNLQDGKTVRIGLTWYKPEDVTSGPRKGLSFVYSTDTRPCKNLEYASVGSDLLITEGIYGDNEKLDSAKSKKHMTSVEAAELSKRAGAKEVWLTHYSPAFRDQHEYEKMIQEINNRVVFACDGKTTTLNFEDETE